ncbi:hypothetical protein F443_21036 [Phytophthora nicotianae P1569]|uniref:Uncharacterized protein n=1 Tax=Phytophthora nicotianae P1569 TaxID=1317065 RepID=V9DZI5_PHYNI|nr:hypothetical protein F443_21036 [Phytophthora nicotianae P1569]
MNAVWAENCHEESKPELPDNSGAPTPLLAGYGTGSVHSTRITPYLTENNKFRRIEHVLTYIDPTSLMFEPMYDVVHVDEKWFYEDVNKRSCLVFETKHRSSVADGVGPAL